MNNQKIKADAGKAKISLVPTNIWYAIAKVREYGNNKYPDGGKDNWKQVEPDRYIDATFRHLLALKDEPYSVDQESGLPHLWHLACNVAFLCDLIEAEPRKPNMPYCGGKMGDICKNCDLYGDKCPYIKKEATL